MTDVKGPCAHCGLPLAGGGEDVVDEQGHGFCCSGCATVFAVIHGAGLDDFYRMRGDESGAPPKSIGRGFQEFDDEEFERLYLRTIDGGLRQVELYLDGVHCSACIWLVERLPSWLAGVKSAELDFGRSVCTLTWDAEEVALSSIARRLDSLGYGPHPARGGRGRAARRAEDRRELVRLGVAGALAMNAMLIAFALYGGIVSGMEAGMRDLLRFYSLGLASASVLWPGRSFIVGALAAIRTRTAHMDLPIAIGILAGLIGGAFNTFAGRGEVYFESVSLLVFFLLVGRYVQRRQQRSARDSMELLHSMTPSVARRLDLATGKFHEVPSTALVNGDRVELLSGDLVPADGELASGVSSFDLALLTGESRPIDLEPGDKVFAGCTNLVRRVEMLVTSVGEETRLGGLLKMVESASIRSAPSVRFADRMAGIFTTVILGLAGLTLALWWRTDSGLAVEYAVALLIVACPCALGLATPLAIVAAVGKAARQGILVQGGEALELLAKPGRIWLDKTGTLTRGDLRVVRALGDACEWAWVLEMESHSKHPMAAALLKGNSDGPIASEAWELRAAVGSDLEQTGEVLGRGLRGKLKGESVLVGSLDFLASEGVSVLEASTSLADFVATALADGLTLCLAARGGRLVAAAGLGDQVRDEALALVKGLKERGWQVGILSGDHPDVVGQVGASLGIEDARGSVSPEGKLLEVENSLAAGAPVVMVGDGVNDAAALGAASVGVAVCGGAEASLAAADVYMARPGLGSLVDLLDGAERLRGVIRRGLWVSLGYNSLAAALAMAGLINPIWAAVLMPVSSLTVVSMAFRSRTFIAVDDAH